MAKANLRLKKPSSQMRLLSRVVVWDVLWGGLSPLGAYLLRDGTIHRPNAVLFYCAVAFLVSVAVFQWFRTSLPISRFYSIRDAFDLLKACLSIAALSAAVAFLLTRLDDAPRSIPILHFMLLASGLLGARVLLRLRDTRREIRRPDATQKVEHVLILEASRLAWLFSKMVEELAPGGYQIVAILDQRPKLKHRSLNGYPIVGTPAELEKAVTDYAVHGVRIDKVVLAAQPKDLPPAAWAEVCRACDQLKIALEVLPERLLSDRSPEVEEAALDAAEAEPATAAGASLAFGRPFWEIKRAIDFGIALGLAILLSPVILAVWAIVSLDVGIPVLFWQQRMGRNGAPLYLYKFRTLQTLFDRRTQQRRDVAEPSPVGRLLRATRLDELPQLWNVLSGEMSLIGPRPLLPVDQPKRPLRLAVRPGVTGWAQVCGGKLVSPEEKSALDEWYIRHASLQLDALIVFRTIWMFMAGDRRDEAAIRVAAAEAAGIELPRFADAQRADMTVPPADLGEAAKVSLS